MATAPPNVLFIITDNQSAWTLGCYGNRDILTPNVDRLAAEGMRFERAFCVNPVCSPNRATCLTGLIPSQHGVHNWLGREQPSAEMGPHAYCTIGEFVTLPQVLAEAGYTCGMCGKWHLGDSLHPQLGFTYWFAKPGGHTYSFYNSEAIWQGKVYTEPRYYTDAITDHALDFLDGAAGEPFFLYVGYNGPYGLDNDLRTGHRNRFTQYYADRELCCFPREERMHPALKRYRDLFGSEKAMRSYAAAVSGVDDGVGRLLEALDERGLAEDTLVIFTADHGLCAGHHGLWGMADHTEPHLMYEENLHIPLVFRHPGRIPSGATWGRMTCNYDLFPSLLDYLGLEERAPGGPELPGRSFAGALRGEEQDWGEEITFHEYLETRTVRTVEWKYSRRHPDGPDELYDMVGDPGERQNLADDPAHAEVVEQMRARLAEFFGRYADPRYDLWRGGRSKSD